AVVLGSPPRQALVGDERNLIDDADLLARDARRMERRAARLIDLLALVAQDPGGPDRRQREDRQRDDADGDHLAVRVLVRGAVVRIVMRGGSAHGCRYLSDAAR